MKNILKLLSILFVSGAALSFASCGEAPAVIPEEQLVMSFRDMPEEGLALNIGDEVVVQVKFTPSYVSGIEKYYYKFVSENENVFSVTQEGVVIANGPGRAKLKAIALNNTDVFTECDVTVTGKLVTEITIAQAGRQISLSRDRTYPTFNLGQYVTVGPSDATDRRVRYISSDENVVKIDEVGALRVFGVGVATIRVQAADGGGAFDEAVVKVTGYEYYPIARTNWTVSETSGTVVLSTMNGCTPESLIDSETSNSALLLIKQGKSETPTGDPGNPVAGPVAPAKPYFVIDLGAPTEFNCFTIMHYASATSTNYRTNGGTLYGSDDGENFTQLESVTYSQSGAAQIWVRMTGTYTYRYMKMEVNAYNTTGNYVLIRDFQLFKYTYELNTFDPAP